MFHHGNSDLTHEHTDISTGYYSALGLDYIAWLLPKPMLSKGKQYKADSETILP